MSQSVDIGVAEDDETALAISPLFNQSIAIGQAFDLENARIITPLVAVDQTVPIGIAVETETAFDIDVSTDGLPLVYFEYEEHLDPIKKRGKAILSRALEPGERISIERKTPITQEIQFREQTLLRPEQLEYAFDKICFIEQEIEGSFCDCRGPVWPFGPPSTEPEESVDARIECQPYDCEAFGDILSEVYGGDVAGLNLSFPSATSETTLSGSKAVVDNIPAGDGYKVLLNQQSAPGNSPQFQITSTPLAVLDECEEGEYDTCLTIFKGTVALRGELVLAGDMDGTWDVVTVIRARRTSPNNSLSDTGGGITQCIGKTIMVDFDYADGAFSTSQAFNQTLFVEDDIIAKTATFKLQINGQRSGNTTTGAEILDIGTITLDPAVPAWSNWSLVQVAITEFTLSEAVDWVIPTRRRVQLDRTFVVRVGYIGEDGEPQVKEMTESYTSYSNAFTGGAITNIEVQPVGSVPVWAVKSDVRIAGIYARKAPIDFDALFLAYRRNLTTYTPPDDCTFTGDVI